MIQIGGPTPRRLQNMKRANRKQAGRSLGGQRRATIRDVARIAGVSPTTVSFVLNGNGSISVEVADRVRAAIAKVHYRRNNQARAIRTGYSGTIGLVVPDLQNPFFPELVEAIGNVLHEKGYAMIVGCGHDEERERESLSRLAAQGVDGICWCPASEIDTPLELGLSQPIVVIDRPMGSYDLVTSNVHMGARMIAEEVRRSGARSIGLVSGPRHLPTAQMRSAAFAQALQTCTHIAWQLESPFSIEIDAKNARWITSHPVDMIVCANDTIAIGVLRVLREAGITVPNDTSVLGFDDIPWCSLVDPPLTTVRQDLPKIGGHAVDLLLKRISAPHGQAQHIEIDVSWRERASTRRRARHKRA